MKISACQFNDSYFPIIDGVGMTAHNYAYWLNRKYARSAMVAPKVKGYKDWADYPVYRFKSILLPGMNPYRVGLPLIDFSFKQKLKMASFDLVHAHCPFVSGQVALRMARKKDLPLVATFHSKYKEDFKKVVNSDGIADFLVGLILGFYHSADQVWVPNRATANTLYDYGFKGKAEIVPNGTDFSLPEKSVHLKLRRKGLLETGAGPDEFVMLFVGQHRWEKNVKMILEAMKILKNTGEHFKMVFAGEGYAAEEMKAIVKKQNLSDRVIFTGLIQDRKKLKSLYASSDLFIFPSLYDNSPLVVQEAAAFDVPSVLVRDSSPAEGVLDGVNGFLIENAAADLARRIRELIKHPEAIRRAGEGARKSLYRPWETIVDEVYLRYAEILETHKKAKQHPRRQATAA
ncbi:MAG TPA: glycosyltransferase [Bacteroidales bacterium]|nr:glycosyltransferase [Bacteroidales bacterium]